MVNNFARFCRNLQSVLKFLNICHFLILTIITSPRNFLSLADGLHDRTPETKNSFEHFSLRNVETFVLNLQFHFFSVGFNY